MSHNVNYVNFEMLESFLSQYIMFLTDFVKQPDAFRFYCPVHRRSVVFMGGLCVAQRASLASAAPMSIMYLRHGGVHGGLASL